MLASLAGNLPILYFLLQTARFSFKIDEYSGAIGVQYHPHPKPLSDFKVINPIRKPSTFKLKVLGSLTNLIPSIKLTLSPGIQFKLASGPTDDEQDLETSKNPFVSTTEKTRNILDTLLSPLRSAGLVDEGTIHTHFS